ncbi:PDZ domain-containing protein [Ginsengibacter hankyongi]|uniref:PDZ domain-containing protein n=1 Tax=Ginsengibacter hankyongi TaxID=2607284 RepID=A0A5J5I9C3_9BACT|nr:PDZ domain-containing protein [Ginsengibacter hankyongi]KAA9034382.1 PDZ domain-containing protein [Ginsengibacter hankyongi]
MKKKLLLSVILLQALFYCTGQDKIYVSAFGSDNNKGTFNRPVKTLGEAIVKALRCTGKDVAIEIRGGSYSLDTTIKISSGNFLLHSLDIRAYKNEKVIISGARKIRPDWQPYRNGILKAVLNLVKPPDQFFVDGKALPMARYPNFDATAKVYNGTAADAISNERINTWKNPAGGYIHALHEGEWGSQDYLITGKKENGKLTYTGGWQNNRPAPMHKQYRFVENIFEELDSPGEWFYDYSAKTIYLYPPDGTDIKKSGFTISQLTDLIHIRGSSSKPLKNITISNLSFTGTARSFMLTKEPLLRSDWTIYRGGAILLDGTENVRISNCNFFELGGNAIFVSNYNRYVAIRDNNIYNIGGNAIAFVGDPGAVRSPAFNYNLFVPWPEMDYTPGPKTDNYPRYCLARGNLIHNIGIIEKQVSGVEVSMSSHITISHNTIYNVPRSGINIGDGCWGGDILEYNDVFNTVLETGDHGAFNSWGRDRYWSPDRSAIDSIVAAKPGIESLDVIDPIVIRNNRFQCDHGWDIDLDDGSSNYRIYNNVCLNGGLKLREGYHRIVTNNILINNTFHLHVWLKNSGDVFMHNIVTTPYAPILMNYWGKKIDANLFLSRAGLAKAQSLHLDKNSLSADALFVNSRVGNYQLKAGSPAFRLGFKNFNMNFGVTSPSLKKIAGKPIIKPLYTHTGNHKGASIKWLGATFKNIETLGERSAAGLHDHNGALLEGLPLHSLAEKNNLKKGDIIIRMGDASIKSISDLTDTYQTVKWMGAANCTIIRNQSEMNITVSFK